MKKTLRGKQEKGVTLLALVITIAIIIILSTVTINSVFGDNGLISQAERAKDLTANSTYAEGENMNSLLQEYANIMAEDGASEITPPDTNQVTPEPPVGEGIGAEDIAKAPDEYYGEEVKGYECESDGVSKWRIFHADDTNIYLIADDYIAGEDAPNGKANNPIYQNNVYKLSFNYVVNDYDGASWINTNSKGAKWLSQLLSSDSSSTNTNVKATAYMMDTNIWSRYAGEDAEYAMGAPTLELFCASYEATHSKYILYNGSSTGYSVKWSSNTGFPWANSVSELTQDEFNSIYIKSDTSKAEGMWIASPSGLSSDDVVCSLYDGSFGGLNMGYIDKDLGLRPIVCLKSDVQLEKLRRRKLTNS